MYIHDRHNDGYRTLFSRIVRSLVRLLWLRKLGSKTCGTSPNGTQLEFQSFHLTTAYAPKYHIFNLNYVFNTSFPILSPYQHGLLCHLLLLWLTKTNEEKGMFVKIYVCQLCLAGSGDPQLRHRPKDILMLGRKNTKLNIVNTPWIAYKMKTARRWCVKHFLVDICVATAYEDL